MSSQEDFRSRMLDRFFYGILEGKSKIGKIEDARRFLESIVNRNDKPDCIERLATSKSGQDALHKSLIFGVSMQLTNTSVSNLLKFLADPDLRMGGDRELLNQILLVMVDPPKFWENFIQQIKYKRLEPQAVDGFSWLLLQLIILPPSQSLAYRETAKSLLEDDTLEDSGSSTAKALFQKIRALVLNSQSRTNTDHISEFSPGGRHDNDLVNYHDISILPTRSELQSAERAFFMQAAAAFEVDSVDRAYSHLDNQFRLLREDMLAEMREDLKVMQGGNRKPSWKNMIIRHLTLDSIDKQSMKDHRPFTLVLKCSYDILEMPHASVEQRKNELTRTPGFLRHQSFGCLMKNETLLAFATVDRKEDHLALHLPHLCIQLTSADTMGEVFSALQEGPVDFLLVSTPIFAYEPILRELQQKIDIELDHDILARSQDPHESTIQPVQMIEALERPLATDSRLQGLLNIAKEIKLDPSQIEALVYGLKYQTCQIQGPPGTGKSLVGAILAKILLDHTDEELLVLSYTNHALDQFLEDLLDIGISEDVIVRLGSKCTNRTEPLLLKNQRHGNFRTSRTRYELIDSHKANLDSLAESIERDFDNYLQDRIPFSQLLEYLEFSETDGRFYDALALPEADDGEVRVGPRGTTMQPDYLFKRWASGKKPGPFVNENSETSFKTIWDMAKADRWAKVQRWRGEIRQERIAALTKRVAEFNKIQEMLQSLRKQHDEKILQTKRVIACTTTGASMYAQEIRKATPGIIIVEEAGEILESHILAAMGPSTKQLIQIGDHKQLRPKVKNYRLTVEAGHGYDLNRSLFERLILQGRPHCTLLNQHRMRPEISALIKHNYPSLKDANGTQNRPPLMGFQDSVIFVNHDQLEAKSNVLVDKLDQGAKSSKQNVFEAEMVLKCVRYLGQQNYKTDHLVILTPYLGQLSLLRNKLRKDHDPILSDIDSHDLVQAGILPKASAKVNKKPIRLSTIDNYQGEESDVVIVSLTRSNEDGDIGFMAAPERLNVLVSRARDALIMIGNANTFMNARKGRDEWTRLFDHLKADGKIYDGFPLRCEKHPKTTFIARSPEDFDQHCPDGGCELPCNEPLSCGKHTCPMRCHLRVDHSKMPCSQVLKDVCPKDHKLQWRCSDKTPPTCQVCWREKLEKERIARRDKELDLDRQAKQQAYAKQLRAIQDGIAAQRKTIQEAKEERTRQQTLERHRVELAQLVEQARKPVDNPIQPKRSAKPIPQPITKNNEVEPRKSQNKNDHRDVSSPTDVPSQPPTENTPTSEADGDDDMSEASHENNQMPTSTGPSSAEADWKHQKDFENVSNEALDSLFKMIGLESVKKEFLTIKAKIDTFLRQGADTKDERLGAALLGNPGTGKTTVARLYAKFLSSVGAIPGEHFEETTGSRLANDGIQGCKAMIDKILEKGGGVFFLDEAYQIVSGSSFGGAQVLDFLLAEIENLTGKVVFVFAGYRKQMEAFFAHNPGIPSRIPIQMDFQDYEDHELLKILNYKLGKKKFNQPMKIEDGPEGLYMRIVARRIGRGRGREGFGNAREVENVLSRLFGGQANRLHLERRNGLVPDDFLLKKIDLVGPEPSKEFSNNKDWQKLQELIGLKSVKQSVSVLVDRLQANYKREMKEKPLVDCSLNKVFIGSPGTGKTSVAKLYGKILKALGLLSNGEVVIKNPADFVGGALGQSEKNTKAILESTKGKVLIIDEAYSLASGLSDTGGASDPYKTAVIDTIVAEVQSTATEDRCVLLLGYRQQMEDMFQKVNPGLARRFPIASGFVFEDFTDDELRKILDLKLRQQGFKADEATKRVVMDVLRRARNRPNFGNAGEVDIILDQAKERQQQRISLKFPGAKNVDVLAPEDIDPDFDRGERAGTNIRMLFKDVIGCDDIVEQLEGYQQVAQNMKAREMDPVSQIPFGFLFRGPPGTGKTTTARKMGKIYYDMGFLAEAKVIDCSATDLIGQYVGQTGPKVQKKFDEALGRVLFVDEAYRLSGGHFAKEAMDEIVDCLTKERYHNKLVVILAGYDDDINRLMNQNPGLTSRFPETISFGNLPARHCRGLLLQELQKRKLDTKDLGASPTLDSKLLSQFGILSRTKSWGNARDVQTLAKSIFSKIMKSKDPDPNGTVPEDIVIGVVQKMIDERTARGAAADNLDPLTFSSPPTQQEQFFQPPPQPKFSTSINTDQTQDEEPKSKPKEKVETKTDKDGDESGGSPENPPVAVRDAGVSDAVWEQLERDKLAAAQRQRELIESQRQAEELARKVREQEEAVQRQKDEAARREELRKLEKARIERELAEIKRKQKEEKMKREKKAQKMLMRMGRCPVGYEWIPQAGGYRCAGGSHWVGEGDLNL
ncbi:P-loop containing nucleoside triphosphate hydrolase protein [Hypoxylon trugodes]|uniref:P-loop containing nucleoside triphosphate hydrolase protein n=1 Tax=Hypoxylon trugodes TaxID=326681 RepID=UPI00219E4FFF|nr:P-loop containing nucleoside triphosphate hydrolase protein [Hypoxylon trugodes]KAI1386218.1 P-loop containing nucleoside triphosphate hydrolase protein [Hypoxylon trugodes]